MKKLLAINLSPEKRDVIWQICDRIGLIPQEVPRAYWGMKVRDLCGEKEFKEADDITYSGRDLSMDMIVLDGISSRELDIFLDGYKSSGLNPVKLKSMVTFRACKGVSVLQDERQIVHKKGKYSYGIRKKKNVIRK